MDLTQISDRELRYRIVKDTIQEKKLKAEKDELFKELERRGIEGGQASVGDKQGLIYRVSESTSRIFDNEKLNDYFGKDADKFKKDKLNPARFSVKLINK